MTQVTALALQRALLLRLAQAIEVGQLRIGRCSVCGRFLRHPPGGRYGYCSGPACQGVRTDRLRGRAVQAPAGAWLGRRVTFRPAAIARLMDALDVMSLRTRRDTVGERRGTLDPDPLPTGGSSEESRTRAGHR